jgi:FkbH-like protein
VDERPTPSAYLRVARELAPFAPQLRAVRVALLASFTIDSLISYLKVEMARRGLWADFYVGPFNNVAQELLDPSSGCARFEPDVVFVAQLVDDVAPELADGVLALAANELDSHIEAVASNLLSNVDAFRQRSSATIVVHNFALPRHAALGIHEVTAELSQTEAIRRLNRRLADASSSIAAVRMLDFDRVCAEVGYANWRDDKLWYLARAPLSSRVMPALAKVQAAFACAATANPRKCLVLDLDNTLWGGVIGEDGVEGIAIGHTYPGSVFRDFQRVLLHLRRRGVLLAINSKNNEADALAAFRTHPDMVLREAHFACTRINWRDKPQNMIEIARELNIGLESLVFFDDSPIEREVMRQSLPQVETLDVPGDPLQYIDAVFENHAFDRLSFTAEDALRAGFYDAQRVRREVERTAASLEDFLAGLEMTMTAAPADSLAFPRIVDLIHKTNQFNLTTRRHTAPQIQTLMRDPACAIFTMQLSDRFGDHGTVGVAILRVEGPRAIIDSFLLSCRVIGRTAETAFLSVLIDWATSRGLLMLVGEFVPTPRNAPASDFFERHGFHSLETAGAGGYWQLPLNETNAMPRHHVRIVDTVRIG